MTIGATAGDSGLERPEPADRGTIPSGRGTTVLSGRGTTVLSDRVVEKIASQAASEVSVAGGRSGGLLGLGAHTDFDARPKVDVELSGDTALLTVEVGVLYPTPLRAATARIREHLISRVGDLAGVRVRRVDIKVAWLSSRHETKRSLR